MADHFSFGSWDIDPVPSSSAQRALARAVVPISTSLRPSLATIRLQFDSVSAPTPGVRGLRARRHCVYALEAEGTPPPALEVMVERVGRHEEWSVVGQIFRASGEGWADCPVELRGSAPGGGLLTGRTNEWGEFALSPAGSGPWRLGVVAGGRRFEVAPVLMP